VNDTSNTPQFDASLAVEQLRILKAKKKEIEDKHEEELKPWKEGIAKISNYLLGYLQSINTQSLKTGKGTINQIHKTSWRIIDNEEFSKHVINAQDFELIQWHVSKIVADARWEADKTEPPGTKREAYIDLGVRAPAKPRAKPAPGPGELSDEEWAKIEAQVDKELDEEENGK
jgi:hypothetical protein